MYYDPSVDLEFRSLAELKTYKKNLTQIILEDVSEITEYLNSILKESYSPKKINFAQLLKLCDEALKAAIWQDDSSEKEEKLNKYIKKINKYSVVDFENKKIVEPSSLKVTLLNGITSEFTVTGKELHTTRKYEIALKYAKKLFKENLSYKKISIGDWETMSCFPRQMFNEKIFEFPKDLTTAFDKFNVFSGRFFSEEQFDELKAYCYFYLAEEYKKLKEKKQ